MKLLLFQHCTSTRFTSRESSGTSIPMTSGGKIFVLVMQYKMTAWIAAVCRILVDAVQALVFERIEYRFDLEMVTVQGNASVSELLCSFDSGFVSPRSLGLTYVLSMPLFCSVI